MKKIIKIIVLMLFFSLHTSIRALISDKQVDSLVLSSDLVMPSKTENFFEKVTSSGNVLFLTGDVQLRHTCFVIGDLTINGQGNSLEICPDARFISVIDSKSHALPALRLKNMNLVVKSSFILQSEIFATLELENVNIFLVSDTCIDDLHFLIKRNVNVYGYDKEILLSRLRINSGVASASCLYCGPGVIFSVKSLPVRNAFDCLDSSASIVFDGSVVRPYHNIGWCLSRGNIFFKRSMRIENIHIDSKEGNELVERSFELGNNGSTEVNTLILPGAQVVVNGYLYHNPL